MSKQQTSLLLIDANTYLKGTQMIVEGFIGGPPERLTSRAQKAYTTFSLAESHGKDEKRTTVWYRVISFTLSELEVDLLSKGQFVRVEGRLEVKPFLKKDGSAAADITLIAFSVTPAELPQKEEVTP